jgi:plasmid stability protein
MATVTVKNIPDQIYETLRALATEHRRSINSEIVYLIEKATRSIKIDPEEHLAAARKLREKTRAFAATDQELSAAKREGRP